jgi:hypothetical protein
MITEPSIRTRQEAESRERGLNAAAETPFRAGGMIPILVPYPSRRMPSGAGIGCAHGFGTEAAATLPRIDENIGK